MMVYCEDCKFYIKELPNYILDGHHCKEFTIRDSTRRRAERTWIRVNSSVKNRDRNCSDYHRIWWKVWV